MLYFLVILSLALSGFVLVQGLQFRSQMLMILKLAETELADSIERLRAGLLSLDNALSAVQTEAFALHARL